MRTLAALVLVGATVAACGAPEPVAGPPGPAGKQGPPGPQGEPGAGGAGGGGGATVASSSSGTGGDAGPASCDAGCCVDSDCPATAYDCSVNVCVEGACHEVARPLAWPCADDACAGAKCACSEKARCLNLVSCDAGGTVYTCGGFSGLSISFNGGLAICTSVGTTVACPPGDPCTVKVDQNPAIQGTCM